MADPKAFADQYGPVAMLAGHQLGVDPSILLGQWGLETGWGKSVIPGTYNLGNIKDVAGGGVAATDNMTGSTDNYRSFSSPGAFADSYVDLIKRKYPGAVGAGSDAQKYADALKQGGYAEDPDYADKVVAASKTVGGLPGILNQVAAAIFPAAQAGELPQAGAQGGDPWAEAAKQFGMPGDAWRQASGTAAADPNDPWAQAAQEFSQGAYAKAQAARQNPNAAPTYADGKGDSVTLHYDQPPATSPQAPASASFGQQLDHQMGLTGRAALAGITGLPNMLWNGPANAINYLAGTHIPLADSNATADWLGLPQPQNRTERVAQDVASALAGTAMPAGLAQRATRLVSPWAQRAAALLSDNIGAQLGTAAAGSAGGSLAREAGYGHKGQLVAALLTGMAPAVATTAAPALMRGALGAGAANRPTMVNTIRAFQLAGTTPTVGQATQGRLAQAIESTLSRAPGGAGIMARKATQQAGEISDRVRQLVNGLSNNAGPVEAGESVAGGLQNFKAGVKNLQNQLYDTLDNYLPPQTPVRVDRTKVALAALNSDIEGAPALSAMFKNGRIQGIEQALGSDLSATTSYGAGPVRRISALPYESIKKLRTLVGNEIDNANFTSDVPRDKWRALYAALSDDLGDAATAAGPQAAQAWNWANQFTKSQMARMEQLSGVMGKDAPEKIYQAAMSGTADGDTVLRRVISAIPKENRRDLAAAVLSRMGRATAGNQDAMGEVFSPATFLTNWNKLSPQARETLFGRVDQPGLLGDLSDLAAVASNIREGSKVFANPSGTSGAMAGMFLTGSGLTSLMAGNLAGAAGAAVTPVFANLGARVMTNPDIVRSLARPTAMPNYLIPGLLGASTPAVQRDLSKPTNAELARALLNARQ